MLRKRGQAVSDNFDVQRYVPYAWVENEVLEDEALDTHDKLTYVMLCKFSSRDGKCFPSYNTLMKLVGCGRERLAKSLNNLIKRGWIIKQNRQKEEGTSNLYFLPGKRLPSSPGERPSSPGELPSSPGERPLVRQANANNTQFNNTHLTNKRTKKLKENSRQKTPSEKYEKFYL